MIKVGINGFGRIGRMVARIIMDRNDMELVAINDLTDAHTLAHLFEYDSVHKKFNGSVQADANHILINSQKVAVYAERNPENIPWKNHEVDVVVESTGVFRTRELAKKHLAGGAKKVVISAPAKSNDVKAIVLGVNDHEIDKNETVISNASCTTNCAAPMIKLIDEMAEITSGFLTTVHAYTGDQRLQDAPHSDLRRARAAAVNMIPTTTGAATAVTKILPHLHKKLHGSAIRVPVPDGSLTELTLTVKKTLSVTEINQAFKNAAENEWKNILDYTDKPLVSSDIVGNTHSCVFDSELTVTISNTLKITGWYDNEIGYSNRLVDLILKFY